MYVWEWASTASELPAAAEFARPHRVLHRAEFYFYVSSFPLLRHWCSFKPLPFSICWSFSDDEWGDKGFLHEGCILQVLWPFFLPHDFVLVRPFDSTWIQEDSKAKSRCLAIHNSSEFCIGLVNIFKYTVGNPNFSASKILLDLLLFYLPFSGLIPELISWICLCRPYFKMRRT